MLARGIEYVMSSKSMLDKVWIRKPEMIQVLDESEKVPFLIIQNLQESNTENRNKNNLLIQRELQLV